MKLRPNRFEIFKNLQGEKLIIIGKKDALVNAEKLMKSLKGTSVNCVKFSEGHMSHIENKSDLYYNILHFIEK
jgi:hypothetical protein